MKIERSKEWWLARAKSEGDSPVGAGCLAFDLSALEPHAVVPAQVVEDVRLAFGKFVNLMRRRRNLSVEQLAAQANLDVSEVLVIEDDVRYTPEPRTVYQLAQFLGVPQRGMMQLAGLTTAKDADLRREAVRFAARSESVSKLTKDETSALEAFVSVLSQFESEKSPK